MASWLPIDPLHDLPQSYWPRRGQFVPPLRGIPSVIFLLSSVKQSTQSLHGCSPRRISLFPHALVSRLSARAFTIRVYSSHHIGLREFLSASRGIAEFLGEPVDKSLPSLIAWWSDATATVHALRRLSHWARDPERNVSLLEVHSRIRPGAIMSSHVPGPLNLADILTRGDFGREGVWSTPACPDHPWTICE